MTTPPPAVRAAEKLYDRYSIEERPPNDGDPAKEADIAQIITAEYAPMVEALEEIAAAKSDLSEDAIGSLLESDNHGDIMKGADAITSNHFASIAIKALQLLKETK